MKHKKPPTSLATPTTTVPGPLAPNPRSTAIWVAVIGIIPALITGSLLPKVLPALSYRLGYSIKINSAQFTALQGEVHSLDSRFHALAGDITATHKTTEAEIEARIHSYETGLEHYRVLLPGVHQELKDEKMHYSADIKALDNASANLRAFLALLAPSASN